MDGTRSNESGTSAIENMTDVNRDSHYQMMYELNSLIYKYTELVMLPTVGIIGLIGNTLSGIIVVKDGLRKPSNILLLGLAVADCASMLGAVNIAHLIRYATPDYYAWLMDVKSITVSYYVYVAITCTSNVALDMSITLLVVITLERFVAVFFPLHFSKLVTTRRAKFAVIMSFIMSVPRAIIVQSGFRLVILYINKWCGVIIRKPNWIGTSIDIYSYIMSWFVMPIVPTTLVIIGCIVIGAKIKVTMQQRKKMTCNTRNRHSSAKTRTMYMVCFFFSITHITLLFRYLPWLTSTGLLKVETFYNMLFSNFSTLVIYINHACNFFIYVIFNPKFRKIITELLCRNKSKK